MHGQLALWIDGRSADRPPGCKVGLGKTPERPLRP